MKLKELMEKRNDVIEQMRALTDSIVEQKRAFTEEENAKFEELRKEADSLDASIEAVKEMETRSLSVIESGNEEENKAEEDIEKRDIASFAAYIRSTVSGIQEREASNMTKTANGAVIPKTIANRIIDKIKEISPLFRDAEQFNVKGTLSIPYVEAASDGIEMAYATEFTDLESKSATLKTVDLTGYLAGVLTKVSKSLVNNTDLDIVGFVVDKIAKEAALFFERETLVGTPGKATGLSTIDTDNQVVTAEKETEVSGDEIIKLKDKLPSVYQNGAYFVMAPETLTAVRLLKDANKRYLLNDDITSEFGATLLGKPVYTSDQCPAMEAGNAAIFYVNPGAGLAAKLTEDIDIQVLLEKYAAQHAIGIVGWTEFDVKIQNQQAVAAIVMAGGSASSD